MHASHSSLLQLRGSFYDSLLSEDDTQSSPKEITDVFQISEEHTIIVTKQSIHLLDLPHQVFLWSIFVAAPIAAAALAPDQPVLALCFPEETVLWDLGNGQVIQRLAHPLSEPENARLVFGPGGMLALTSLSEGVQLWNVEAGQLLHTLIDEEGKYLVPPSFKSMEFSPDGEFLAIADADSFANVWLWRVADGRVHQMLYGHPWSHRILGLAFTPDGRYLVGSC